MDVNKTDSITLTTLGFLPEFRLERRALQATVNALQTRFCGGVY